METIVIRPATGNDLKIIAGIFHDAVQRVAIQNYTEEQVQAWSPCERPVEHWAKRTADLQLKLAEIINVPAGFIGYSHTGYIDLLFSRPEFLRRGVARSLLQDAERDLKIRHVTIAHANVSLTARPFFEAMGYACLRTQLVSCGAVELQNFGMEKKLI